MRLRDSLRANPRRHALFVAVALSFVFVLAYPSFETKAVYSWEQLREVKFGLPFPFLMQHQNYNPPLPYDASFATIQEHGTMVLPHWLLLDLLIVFCCMALVGIVLLNTVFRLRQEVALRWFSIFGYGILACLFALVALFVLMIVVLSLVYGASGGA